MANPASQILSVDQPNAFTLRLGPDKQEMLVDPNRLARTSDRFKALLANKLPEGQARILSLPAISYQAMSIYIHFINFGTFPTKKEFRAGEVPDQALRNHVYDKLTTLYFVGQKLDDRTFSNAVIREILRIFDLYRLAADRGVPGFRTIHVMYESTPPTVVGRRMLVDMYTNFGSAGQLYSHNAACNPTFLRDLAQELLKKATEDIAPDSYRLQPLDADDYMI